MSFLKHKCHYCNELFRYALTFHLHLIKEHGERLYGRTRRK
jgi:uncharacterized C2H2 Zn-finger protein